MPGSTLPNISIVLPSLGGDEGIWDTEINAALSLLDAHDHTSGKGLRIASAAIDINADLSYGGYFISALGKMSFTAIAAPSTGSKALYVSSADNELYWRTNGGTNVKLTSGTALNISIVGGIVGDYASTGAEVAYDDANDRYTFKQQTTFPWAKIACGGIQLFEFNTTESVSVRLLAPSVLGASYDLTFPSAVPGTVALMQVSTAGVITFTNTTTEEITAADFNHTNTLTYQLPGSAWVVSAAGQVFSTSAAGYRRGFVIQADGAKFTMPLDHFKIGDNIISWTVRLSKTSGVGETVSARLYKTSGTTETAIGSGNTNSANNPGLITLLELPTAEVVAADTQYYLVAFGGATAATDILLDASVSFTRPS